MPICDRPTAQAIALSLVGLGVSGSGDRVGDRVADEPLSYT